MPERSGYRPGVPGWADLTTTDLDGAKDFYARLFGWEVKTSEDPRAGGYSIAHLRGRAVAGLGLAFPEGTPSSWNAYVIVSDAETTAQAVRAAGGEVVMGPIQVMEEGVMAVCRDLEGAFFSIWQPGATFGAGLVDEPGALSWTELQSRDPGKARRFYPGVFGWTPSAEGEGREYTEWVLDGEPVAGMMPMPPDVPADVSPHWLVYFAVSDCDEAVATATGAGAAVVAGPVDIPIGRFAVLADPQRAVAGVIAFGPSD